MKWGTLLLGKTTISFLPRCGDMSLSANSRRVLALLINTSVNTA
jgi:hypothetical protein